jgi:hypothetical protein
MKIIKLRPYLFLLITCADGQKKLPRDPSYDCKEALLHR